MLNINFQTTIITALISLILGIFGGSWITHGLMSEKVFKVEEELTALKTSSKAAEIQYNKDRQLLSDQITSIQKDADEKIEASNKTFEDYKIKQLKNISRKNVEISNMRILISTKENDLASLRSDLEFAKTEVEKEVIRSKILEEEKLLLESKLRIEGLNCLSIPIPKEYLDTINF